MSDKQQEFQDKYFQVQVLGQEIEKIQQQLRVLNQQLMEMVKIEESLNDFEKIKNDSEILVPLGNGIFAKANLKSNNELLMGVGANIFDGKSVSEVKERVTSQVNEIKQLASVMESELQETVIVYQGLIEEVNKLASEAMK